VPGVPERLAAESGGSFAPTPEDLVREVRRWRAMSRDDRWRHGEGAFQYGIKNFSLDVNVGKLEEVLVGAMRSA